MADGCVFLALAGGFEVNPGRVNLRVHDAPPRTGHGCVFLAAAEGFEVNPGWVNLRVHDAPPIGDTGIRGYRDTRIKGYRDTGIHGYRDARRCGPDT